MSWQDDSLVVMPTTNLEAIKLWAEKAAVFCGSNFEKDVLASDALFYLAKNPCQNALSFFDLDMTRGDGKLIKDYKRVLNNDFGLLAELEAFIDSIESNIASLSRTGKASDEDMVLVTSKPNSVYRSTLKAIVLRSEKRQIINLATKMILGAELYELALADLIEGGVISRLGPKKLIHEPSYAAYRKARGELLHV